MILFYADTRHASATSDDPVTTGSAGIPVTVTLTPDYTGLNATLVFENGTTYADVPLLGQDVTVPRDVCLKTGKLRMGVYASDQSGEVVIPTIWADVSPVVVGVRPSGIDPAPPAPSWADLVMEAARTAREDAEAARADADSAREDADAARYDADRALSISNDVEMLEDVSASLTPFFSRNPPYGGAYYDDYWNSYSSYYLTNMDGGWVHVRDDRSNEQGSGLWGYELASVKPIGHLRPGRQYTFMIEVRNFSWVSGDVANAPRLSVSTGRDGSGYGSQVYAETDSNFVQINGDGEYVIQTTGSLNQNATNLISIGASAYSGTSFEYDMRVSLYSGAHAGNYIANPTGIDDRLSSVSTVADEAHAMNLTPMFSAYDDDSYWNSISAKYGDEPHPRNGWIGLHVTDDDELRYVLIADLDVLDWIVSGAPYTLLIEVVGLDESSAEATLKIDVSASQLYQRSTGYADVTTTITDGSYRFFMSARDNAHSSFFTCATSFSILVPSGVEATFAVRASLYDGDYTGEYKPCLSWINGEVEGLSETVNSLDETVGELSDTVTTLNNQTTTLSGDLSHLQDVVDGIADSQCRCGYNITPFFSHGAPASGTSDDYWASVPNAVQSIGGGWAHVHKALGDSQSAYTSNTVRVKALAAINPEARYTLLVEVRNLTCVQTEGATPNDNTPKIEVLAVDGTAYQYTNQLGHDLGPEVWVFGDDGSHHYPLVASYYARNKVYLIATNIMLPSGKTTDFDLRLSLYEGDYDGSYRPCLDWMEETLLSLVSRVVALEA